MKKRKRIYLDYAAATPVSKEALEAMRPYFSDKFYNPSAGYLSSRQARIELAELRSDIASILGARPAEIIFTSGATEANNLAVVGVLNEFPEANILISSIEHESVLSPAQTVHSKEIPVDNNGIVDLDKLENLIDEHTVLISVGFINNEIGSIQPVKDISKIVQSKRQKRIRDNNNRPLYLHTDAAQATNYLDLHINRLGVDLATISSGKIYGPKGVGCLYVKAGTKIGPIVRGGGQEFGIRSGTENLAAISGFTAALKIAQSSHAKESVKVLNIRNYFETRIVEILPKAVINGGKKRAPHIISITIPGSDNELLMMKLDERGVECATGSACMASSDEPSKTLTSIGLSHQDARSTLRFSLGKDSSMKDIIKTLAILKAAVEDS
jgi:cysteine desulfurase